MHTRMPALAHRVSRPRGLLTLWAGVRQEKLDHQIGLTKPGKAEHNMRREHRKTTCA